MSRLVASIALIVLLIVTSAVYLTGLSNVPPYLMHDEVNFSLQAHAIATTARDTNGRLLPVYFSETGFEAGRDPLLIYWTALFLTMRPLSEAAVRFPTALLAVVSVGLMFLLVRRWLRNDVAALLAAALLAFTPGYFTNARLALSITYAVPVIIAWLYCLQRALDSKQPRWAMASGVVLGIGIYTYLASVVVMPLLLVAACGVCVRRDRRGDAAQMLLGFGVMLLPLIVWLIMHPDRFTNIYVAYRPSGMATSGGVRERLTAFWMFFSPDYLFISGDGRLTNSTRQAGLFPIAFAVLIPVGLYQLVRERGPVGALVAFGFFLSPIATALLGHLEINRVLTAIPFGVLAASAGASHLWAMNGAVKWIAAVLVLGVAIQFAGFQAHYLGPYRTQAGFWFGGNSRTAINLVLERATPDTPEIYLNRRTPIERYWRFYVAARHRDDLAERPIYYDPSELDIDSLPPGALLICESELVMAKQLAARSGWHHLGSGVQPDGTASHEVFERAR